MTGWREHWCDEAWWENQIHLAIAHKDLAISNLRVTLLHYELSLALREVLGADAGANFHTWAVWGSKKAGTTIRQEDFPGVRLLMALGGAGLGGLLGVAGSAWGSGRASWGRPLLSAVCAGGAALGGWGLHAFADRLLDETTQIIRGGNVTVLDDIGRMTARFVCAFHDHPDPDRRRLEGFLLRLRPGPAESGGQDLLRQAFTRYYLARHEPDLDKKHEHMLLANLSAFLHEQTRLEPYIDAVMPRPVRRLMTSRLLNVTFGPQELRVGEDVLPYEEPDHPATLQRLEDPDLVRFLSGPGGWDRTPDSLTRSRAGDWSEIQDRMNYVCDLFRSRHFDPNLFSSPFTDEQVRDLLDDRVPSGPL